MADVVSRDRTRVKNRIHAVLQCYNVGIDFADLFGDGGRAELLGRISELPPYSGESVIEQLQTVDWLETQVAECEQKLEQMLYPSLARDLLDSMFDGLVRTPRPVEYDGRTCGLN